MKKEFISIILLITLISGCATTGSQPQNKWQLIYHHDNAGSAIRGDKQRLVNLIKQGHPVRIHWALAADFSHIADAGFLTVMNGEVFAQLDGIIRQIPERSESRQTRKRIALDAEEQSRWHAIVSTTGEIRAFQSKSAQLNANRRGLEWYVLAPDERQ
ncbi:hypothetical protein [Marinicella sp. W31]|uniref:hypothetical protein n=1 Tax=Marinicella sp. W31 TaxID=3023713 RepID=UPI003757D5B1